MKAAIWAVLMFGALLGHGCGGISTDEQTSWKAERVRWEWPWLADEPACLTVWLIDGDGCAVSADGTTLDACASGPDPYVMLAVPDRFGTCKIGIRDCEEGLCQ